MPQRGIAATLVALLTRGPSVDELDADEWLSDILLLASANRLPEVKVAATRGGLLDATFLKDPDDRSMSECELRDGEMKPKRERTMDRVRPLAINAAAFIQMLASKMKHRIQVSNFATRTEFGSFATQLPMGEPITVKAYLYHGTQECSLNLTYHGLH